MKKHGSPQAPTLVENSPIQKVIIVARLVRGNVYGRLSYDVTPDIEVYASMIYSEVVTWDKPTQSFFKSDNLNIACDNPFLPSCVAASCVVNAN